MAVIAQAAWLEVRLHLHACAGVDHRTTAPQHSKMPAVLSLPARRLRQKTSPGSFVARGEQGCVVWTTEEDLEPEQGGSVKSVYLITLPALTREAVEARGRTCPSKWSHEDVARVVLDSFKSPVHATKGNQTWGTQVELRSFVVFRERHAPRDGETVGPYHFHIALKASASFRFAPYKRALSVTHKLASHWSCTHTGYWSAVRYGCMPTPKKPKDSLDATPYTWSHDGAHPNLFEMCQEPTTAAALARRRLLKVTQASERSPQRRFVRSGGDAPARSGGQPIAPVLPAPRIP